MKTAITKTAPSSQKEFDKSFLDPEVILRRVGLRPGEVMADFGCGSGYFVLPAARLVGDSGIAYGVDVLKVALSSMSTKARVFGLPNVRPVWSNVEVVGGAAEIPDKSVDLICLVQLFFQSKDHQAIIQEVRRVAKDNARVLVIDWNDYKRYFGPVLANRVKSDDIIFLFKQHGFHHVEEVETDPYHFGLLFRRK